MADVDMDNASRARGEQRRLGRYLRLGISTNPFFHTTMADGGPEGEGTVLARRLLEDHSWQVLEIRGEKGAGKTHLQRWLLSRLASDPATSYRHLPEPARVGLPPRSCRVFSLDEAQRARDEDLAALGAWARRPGHRLLLGTHEPCLEALGWAPEEAGVRRVVVDHLERADAEGWVRDRLAQAAVPGRSVEVQVLPEAWEELLRVAGENFLRFTDVLYQVGQRLPEDGRIRGADVRAAAVRLDDEGP
jgi:hypothetical protein